MPVERYICIHGHFYQPPWENPWLEAVELQDSAYPYHDWNERVADECYDPNTASRILDDEGRIDRIVNNYARISFNFGPTLLAWMQRRSPDVYQALVAADQESRERYGGHGSAIAQVYNHVIMPLATRRDKQTQVRWGIRDFVQRFGRQPEGMWLPETAVDIETLEVLVENGIRYTILAPGQAARVRPIGSNDWQDVRGGRIDPAMPYVQQLPSGHSIALFFYDGPISHAVGFEGLLDDGMQFVERLLGGFDDRRDHPQLVHIATDGESYGHYHPRGDMALSYALHHIEHSNDVRLGNYGEFLELHPPTYEVAIIERSSRSCVHGVERWRSDCGCRTGKQPAWNQKWRAPLREAIDWLREQVGPHYERAAAELLADPWAARADYIKVILDRSPENVGDFFDQHARQPIAGEQRVRALKLLELQRHLQLCYTSSAWFYDDISQPESVQILQYAGRALQLFNQLFADSGIEAGFLERLAAARSNLAERGNGRQIYEQRMQRTAVDLERVALHYAVSSLYENYLDLSDIYCYQVEREDEQRFTPGTAHIGVGQLRISSTITYEQRRLCFGVIDFGDQNINAATQELDESRYAELIRELRQADALNDAAAGLRILDRAFDGLKPALRSLFRDQQRIFMHRMLDSTLADDEALYRQIYERRAPVMRMLLPLNTPLPASFQTAAELIINSDLRRVFAVDEPDIEQTRHLLAEAVEWNITLDTAGLAYTLEQSLERVAAEVREQRGDIEPLRRLAALVAMAAELPFEADLWDTQNTYAEITQGVYVEVLDRADAGDIEAQTWVNEFLDLGDKLGFHVTDRNTMSTLPTVVSTIQEVIAQPIIPRATYRLQFNADFTFADAAALIAYLTDLGVSHCYASPILKPCAGSSHGYDIANPTLINPALGGEEALDSFANALRAHGLGLIIDIVPNHMGIGDDANEWWLDVLENGPSSSYAHFFDIEWNPVKPELANKVLLPILGDQYGRVLERSEFKLVYHEGSFSVYYYEHHLPVAPGTYSLILSHPLERLLNELGPDDPHMQEYQSVLTALSYLPERTETDQEKIVERNREKEVIKRRIAALAHDCPAARAAIDSAVHAFNGTVGDPRSFDALDELLAQQAYRPAFWRVAAEEINYRRFFDINELAAIRTEDPEVFETTHQLMFRLLAEGKVEGLRLDHIDGLFDPTGYLRRIQERYVLAHVRARLEAAREVEMDDELLAERVAAQLMLLYPEQRAEGDEAAIWPLYVVAEKILSDNEPLPAWWAVHGTTGYDFLNAVNGIFVAEANSSRFDQIYARFSGMNRPFSELVNSKKKMTMLVSMASEIYTLSHRLERIAEKNRRYRDFTLDTLTFAMREVIASLQVYRTYITDTDSVTQRDRQFIEEAVADARRRNPRTAAAIFEFIRDTLLLRNLADFREEDQEMLRRWVGKFQQVTGPVMAKGVEDTTFYIYNRLASLNEVGTHPEHFGHSVDYFHTHNHTMCRDWPYTMLGSSTHDTKRSEDVRARINVLSEMPDEWETALECWFELNQRFHTTVERQPAPWANDEYLLYQSLVGAWPYEDRGNDDWLRSTEFGVFRERIADYMQKATKEAKERTSWVNPNQAYDEAMHHFVMQVLDPAQSLEFLHGVRALVRRVTPYGQVNSLAQTLFKLTAPGVPDIYQGSEFWDLSLVDPDNRRPVDFARRRATLADLRQRSAKAGPDLRSLAHELFTAADDGRIKLYLIERILNFRNQQNRLFAHGDYLGLHATGSRAEHVCAFRRRHNGSELIAVAPRLVAGLSREQDSPPLGKVWKDTRLLLPEDSAGAGYRNVLTGAELAPAAAKGTAPAGLDLSAICADLPVALLVKQ
jgi:(1->4)-alpha-D-glucan 1-alpha-D-glucosylmutase